MHAKKAPKSSDTYEILVLLFGAIGLNRVYLRDWGTFAVRSLVALAALVLLVAGLSIVDTGILLAAGAAAAMALAFWVHDYATMERQVARYEARMLQKAACASSTSTSSSPSTTSTP